MQALLNFKLLFNVKPPWRIATTVFLFLYYIFLLYIMFRINQKLCRFRQRQFFLQRELLADPA